MKKIFTVIICVMLVLSMGVGASADSKIPESFMKTLTNYTADGSVSVVFEDASDILNLLNELEMPEEISYFVDVDMLLRSLFTDKTTMKTQVDFSDDFSKIKAGITLDNEQDVNFNQNLNIGIKSKTGIWVNIDLSNSASPVFNITVSLPITNKYFSIDMTEYLDEDAIAALKAIYNKEFFEKVTTSLNEVMAKYLKITEIKNGFTMSIDNDGFTALCDEMIPIIFDIVNDVAGIDEQFEYSDAYLPQYKGMQLLGKDGLKGTYTVTNGIVTSGEEVTDISIDISKIYEVTTGEEWPYSSSGKIDMLVTEKVNISRIGSTVVDYPVLTEDNSVSLNELITEESYPYDEPSYDEPSYPGYYVDGYSETLPVVNGEIYVPLRTTLENAYSDTVTIEYNSGEIITASDFFPGFKTLTMKVGADKVYTDGAEHIIGNIMLINNTTYVSAKLFTDIFGWELAYANHNLILNEYDYFFYTQTY